ncbi:phospholipase-like protein [Tanacetum coccineum]|uniref:Phospholipase-like protein n=1 Tax=Tanacetum coccineum TaxID=301880 RepID=A0ABQ5I960_9ASTR
MAKSNQLYDVKIYVRPTVKLLKEIKLLLERNPTLERLFRRTVFGRWLDILSHDNDNHLMHYVLHHQDSNLILELYATPLEMKESWLIASINFINGLVDEDMNVSQDDGAGVVNCVDFQHNSVLANSVLSANSHEGLNGQLFLDSDRRAKNPVTNKDKQPTMAEIFAEIRALRKEVMLVKVDDERIAKLERLVNQIVVNEGNGGSSKDLVSTCSRPEIDNVKVVGDGMPIGNADRNHDIGIGLHNALNQGLGGSSNDPMSSSCPADIDNGEVAGDGMPIGNADGNHDIDISSSCPADIDNGEVASDGIGIVNFDGKNDIPNDNPNSVNQVFGGSANDPMSTCSLTDMDNGEVACDGMVIDNADEKNEYTYSQRAPSTLDVLIKALDSANDNPGFDVLQHDNAVDRSVAELNHHPTADIHVHEEHEEKHGAKYSLDEMKLIDEDEKLIVKDPPVKQHVDAFINEQEDKTTVFLENVKHESNKSQYFNVVKDDYKPCLANVFSNVKPKRKKRGFERNYVLRSVKERKRKLAMSLGSPYGQQASTTPAPPKIRSQSINGDFIAAPDFEEDVYGAPKIREPDADWAMVSPNFSPSILGGTMPEYYSNGVRYPVAWSDVEKVYFPVNEPKKHWCLAELHISTGVVTFYDSLGYVCGNRRPWWRTMKRNLPQQLTLYLNQHGVLKSKGISVESYEIKYMFPKVVEQADLYGDCGVWVCIFYTY